MSFVTVGSAGDAPTFFEMVAAERLMPSLKSAVIYAISVYAQRSPRLLRLLEHEDELFFLISIFLERNSLLQNQSSFAESLYSLQRIPSITTTIPPTTYSTPTSISTSPIIPNEPARAMSPAQRRNSLMLITLLPYLKSKLDSLYFQEAIRRQQHNQQHNQRQQKYKYIMNLFMKLYPFIHATHEGAHFVYQLLYLLGKSRYYSPELHALGLIVTRMSGQQAMAAIKWREERKAERMQRARSSSGFAFVRIIREMIAKMSNIVSEHSRSALVLAVFAFKLLEWYYTSLEQQISAQKMLPPPPPPPCIQPAPGGIPLPDDLSTCPLCKKERKNPAMISTSGYVYCYPCAYRFVEVNGCCPVTRMPARVDHIRRLYQTT